MHSVLDHRITALQQGMAALGLDAVMFCDRENLTYFAGACDLEGAALAVPSRGPAELICHVLDRDHARQASGCEHIRPYVFPGQTKSGAMGDWLARRKLEKPRVGFTRYFVNLKDFLCLQQAAPDMVVCDAAELCYRLRSVKDAEEIARIERAASFLLPGMEAAIAAVRPGVSETAVLAAAEQAMRTAGSEGSPFRMQVLTASRQQQLHPYAGAHALENDAPVVIHLGASCRGYVAKMCRTVFLGRPPARSLALYETLRAAQDAVYAALRPGATCAELYAAARDTVAATDFVSGWRLKEIGYGVGIRQSEFYPILAEGNPTALEANMVVDFLLATLYGPDGGPRLTDTVLVTADGCRSLTPFSRELLRR